MPMTLHLGVIDIPYGNPTLAPLKAKKGKITAKGKKKKASVKKAASAKTITTGDVAEILEEEYHIMRQFFEMNSGAIVKDLEKSLAGKLESVLLGALPNGDPFLEGTSKIDERFRRFLTRGDLEKVGYPGVPTQAALRGVNHRLKHPYKRRAPRPSFIDTGLYQANFKSWVEEK
jgi:hypothetical protein